MDQKESSHSLSTLISFIRPYHKWIWLSVIFSILVGLIDISLAILIQYLLDMAVLTTETNLSIFLFYAILVAMSLGVLFKYIVKYTSVNFSANVLQNIRSRMFRKFTLMPVSYAEGQHSGELGSRMNNDTATLEQILENKFYEYVYHPIVFICAFIYLFQINWALLLFSIILMPTSSYLIGRLAKPLDIMAKKMQSQYGEINSAMQDTVGGMGVLKAYNLEPEFQQKYKGILGRLFQRTMWMEKRKAFMEPVNTIQIWGTYFLCTVLSAYLSAANYITVGELLVFLVLINQLINPISALPSLISNYKLAVAVAGRIGEVLEVEDERQDSEKKHNKSKNEGLELQHSKSSPVLDIRNLSFGYVPDQLIVKNVNLQIEIGKMVAVVGPSGSGKSTLFNLICGFLHPQHGEILIQGKWTERISTRELRSLIALVSQDSYLFPGTVAENLLIANMKAGKEKMIAAAKAANAHDFIESLPLGYDTVIEERGANFSGGQKQRLAIARALLKDAPILLLDEPTSALDTHSEECIQQTIMDIRKERAVIVIAHRFSTIIDADHIVVLDQGMIRQEGSHESLMQDEGIYKQLFQNQQSERDERKQEGSNL